MKTIVFVDYWNLQLSIQQEDAKALNIDPIHTHRFQIDWFNLGQVITQCAQEKGVDTLLATDLLRLGLDYTYEVAIIVSQDSDMKPAVDHLSSKGIKVIHAGIKHYGANLSNSCWAKFDLFPIRQQIQRA